jgi:hypothetical protein
VRLRHTQDFSFDIGVQHHTFNAVFPTVDFTSTQTRTLNVFSVRARLVDTL